jgi:hypothetical protein
VVTPYDDSDVGCTIGRVEASESNQASLTQLTDCQDPVRFSKRVLAGGLVTTDPCGQAVINSPCGTIYVFHDSGLTFSPCDRQSSTSASGCLVQGMIAWDNKCPEGVAEIYTPSARMTLSGTWISAAYVPDQRVALFTVLEGRAQASPLDGSGTPIGRPTDVPAGTFWFSGPAGEPANVGGLEGQQAYTLDQLPPVVAQLQLESWMAAVKVRAAADGIPTDLQTPPVINVRAQGGRLDDPVAQDGLLLAMDWPGSFREQFPDGNGTIFGLIGSRAPTNLAFSSQDLEAAFALVERAGAAGASLVLIVDKAGSLPLLGERYASLLKDLHFDVDLQIPGPDEAARLYNERAAKGQPTIWLTTR